MEVYGDTTLSQNFDFISKNKNQLPFEINQRNALHKGVTNAIWWVKFHLKNETSTIQELLLEIGNQDINLLQLFIVRKSGVEKSILTGDALPFIQRPIQHRHFLFPIRLQPNEQVEAYLMSNKHSEAYVMPVELWKRQAFLERDGHTSLLFGMYFGLLILYIFIPLLLILLFRKKIMVYYFLLAASLSLYILATEGIGFQFFWSNAHPDFNKVIRPGLTGFQFLFLLLFVIEYFKERTTFSRLCKILVFGKNILLVLLPIGILTAFFGMGTVYSSQLNSFFLGLQFFLVFGLFMIVLAIAFGDFVRRQSLEVFGMGLVVFVHVLTFVIGMLNNFGKINSGPDFHNIMMITLSLELIMISIILFSEYWNLFSQKNKLQKENLAFELEIANTLLKGQEKERLRITSELHENLQPLLRNINDYLKKNENSDSRIPFQKMTELLKSSEVELEKISTNLIPKNLFEQNLEKVIESYCQMVNETASLNVHFSKHYIHHQFSKEEEMNIYRIVQELLNNVIQHAQAKNVNILLSQKENQLFISVEDDGIGLSRTENRFNILRGRVAKLKGQVEFSKGEMLGLKVNIQFPIIIND